MYKLLTPIHLFYRKETTKNDHHSKFEQYLRNRVFDDVIRNPLLDGFDIEAAKKEKDKNYREKFEAEIKSIQQDEQFLFKNEFLEEKEIIKRYFIVVIGS